MGTSDEVSSGQQKIRFLRGREILTSGAIFFFLYPSIIVIHELMHLMVALSFGLDAHLHWNRVTYRPEGPWVPLDDLHIWILLAGPMVEFTLWVVGTTFLIALRWRHPARSATALEWFATAASLCCMRWFKTTVEIAWFDRMPDEALISDLLGWSPFTLSWVLCVLAMITVYLVFRLHPARDRFVPLFLAILFGVLGIFIWIFILGPVMLP